MPPRGSAAPSDHGVGDGGGVSGQMADTHTSNWLLAVAQRADENMTRQQTLVEETKVFAEESARLADEGRGWVCSWNLLERIATQHSLAHSTCRRCRRGWAQWKVRSQDRCADRCSDRISRLHRKMNAIAEKLKVLNGEVLALPAEMAHFWETYPAAARSAGGTETNLPPRAGPFQTGGDAAPSGRAATGDAPPAQNDAKVVVADGESHSRGRH